MTDVFISYSRRDGAAFAEQLQGQLVDAGIDAWMDRTDIAVSVPWIGAVRSGIAGALLMVVIDTPEWHVSLSCAHEVQAANELRVPQAAVDPGAGIDVAVRRVRDRCAQEGRPGRIRADVTKRTADWLDSGESGRHLLRGKALRSLRRAVRRDHVSLSRDAQRFLAASARRNGRARVLRILGVSMLLFFIALAYSIPKALDKNRQMLEPATRTMIEQEQIAGLVKTSPFDALNHAARRGRITADGFVDRRNLMDALAVPLPDRVRRVRRAELQAARPFCSVRNGCRSSRRAGLVARWVAEDGVVELTGTDGAVRRRITVGAGVYALSLSPDGRLLAVGRGDVRLFSVQTGDLVTELRGAPSEIRAIDWSRDGERVTAVADERVVRWTWRPDVAVLADDPDTFFVGLAPTGSAAATAVTRDGRIIAVDKGRRPRTVARVRGTVTAAVASTSRGTLLLVGPELLHLVDAVSIRTLRTVLNPCDAFGATYALDDRSAWLVCGDETVRRVELPSLRETETVAVGERGALRVVPRGDEVFIADATGGVSMFGRDGRIHQLARTRCAAQARSLVVDRAGTTFVAVGDGVGKLACTAVGRRSPDGSWSVSTHLAPRRPGQQARAANISPDGRVVALGYSDGTVVMFTLPNQTPGWTSIGLPGAIRTLEFTSDGALIAGTREGIVGRVKGCRMCFDSGALADQAARRLRVAERLGLWKAP